MFNLGGHAIFRTPIATRSRVTRIIGRPRVQAVEIENLESGERRVIGCDTVVFTRDWIPDHELACSAGIELDPATIRPLVDTADIAALDGMFVADEIHRCLSSPPAPPTPALRLKPGPTLGSLAPGLLSPDADPPRGRLLARTYRLCGFPADRRSTLSRD